MRGDFSPVTIVKQLDAASPKLRYAAAAGQHIKKVRIEMYEGQFRFFLVALVQTVMPDLASVPNMLTASSPSVLVLQERASFSYGKITWTYTKQKMALPFFFPGCKTQPQKAGIKPAFSCYVYFVCRCF